MLQDELLAIRELHVASNRTFNMSSVPPVTHQGRRTDITTLCPKHVQQRFHGRRSHPLHVVVMGVELLTKLTCYCAFVRWHM
jgi:hypothetical protein